MQARFAMRREHIRRFFTDGELRTLAELTGASADRSIQRFEDADPVDLGRLEVLVTGWASPFVDARWLDAMPRLQAVVHTTGTVKGHLDAEVWRRGILVSSAADHNAVPVAEYTLAMILLGGKDAFGLAADYREHPRAMQLLHERPDIGTYRLPVGVVGASRIGRRVLELLRPHDVDLAVHDPYLDPVEAARLGATPLPLDELLARSRVVTLHAPLTTETAGMVGRDELAAMPDGALLINTARAGLVDQDALVEELSSGRLRAVLDVTDPEVLPPGHPLLRLPNAVVTPHLAGAMGNELLRLGSSAYAELLRLVRGEPLHHLVDAGRLPISA